MANREQQHRASVPIRRHIDEVVRRRKSRSGQGGRVPAVYRFWTTWGVPLTLILLIVYFSIASPNFLTYNNITTVFQEQAIIALASIGTTLIIISGGIDLTMGAVVALATVLAMLAAVDWGWPMLLAILLAVVAGAIVGLINGLLITKLHIPPLIATLGMLLVTQGFAFVISNNQGITGPQIPVWFTYIGQGSVLGIPFLALIVVIVYLIAAFVTRYTVFGQHTYAVGSNEHSSRLAGIGVDRHRLILYTLGGLGSAVAGVALSAQLGSGQAINGGNDYVFDILASILLGGTSIVGGQGKVLRTLMGVMLIGVLNNGLNLLNVNSFYQMIVTGIILIFALAMDRLGMRSRDVARD